MDYVFLSNATQYAGPGIVAVLVARGYRLLCHDASFTDTETREQFARKHHVNCLAGQTPDQIFAELAEASSVKRYIFNDVHANTPKPYCEIDSVEFSTAFKALVEFPFELSKRAYANLQKAHTGHMVFITSARQLQPEPGFSVATSVRSAATGLALSLAREAAAYNIQVNVIQPNFLYSEMYYPKAVYIDTPEGREQIKQQVPLGRLGQPEELGELVELFVSGRSAFTTGQVINFTGGWP